jgi:hypothetical protein
MRKEETKRKTEKKKRRREEALPSLPLPKPISRKIRLDMSHGH